MRSQTVGYPIKTPLGYFWEKDTFLPQESKPAFLNNLAFNYISQL